MSFRLLGPLQVESGGRPVRLGGPRQSKLLAVLLINVNVVPFERLVDALWDDPPQSARQQVHNVVGGLRRMLATLAVRAEVELITTDVGYRIDVPDELIDLRVFQARVDAAERAQAEGRLDDAVQHLRVGLDLWRGPALGGLGGKYLRSVAARLNEQQIAAREQLFALRLRRGEAGSLVSDLVELVAEHPLRESLRGTLMVALHRSGRQSEALSVFDEGRRLLADLLGLDPGPQLQELHSRILRGDDGADTVESGAGSGVHGPVQTAIDNAAAGDGAAPAIETVTEATRRLLPHDTRDFTGRTAEVARLLSEARETGATALAILTIDGMGGVGKTTLAVHLAHLLARDYPDGQIFIDLHGFSPDTEPLTPSQALDELLRSIGTPPEQIPPDVESRAALWRSRLAGTRTLLLLDNAADAARIRPLLPGTAGSLVIVTSRRRLTALDGTVPLSLNPLPPDEALGLFERVAGVERGRADRRPVIEVVELCGRLPLAIRIAAARFRDRKSWTVDRLVDHLRSRRRCRFLAVEDRSVVAALTLSYRHLDPEPRRMFRLLSLHPGPDFDLPAVVALAGLPPEEAEPHLDALFENNLLMQQVAGRYQFHPLVRDCARYLLDRHDDESQQQAAIHRLLDYYLFLANTGCRPMAREPFRFDPDVTYKPFHLPPCDAGGLAAEYHDLVAVARFASEAGWRTHAWQLPCSFQPLLIQRGGTDAVDLFRAAVRAAEADSDRHGLAASLTGLALIRRSHGAAVEARQLLERAAAVSREPNNPGARTHRSRVPAR